MPETPRYLRIAAELRERMANGDLPPGAKIPSQNKLKDQYGSSTAVTYALKILEAEGRIERIRGSGTYVRDTTRLVRRAHARDMRAQAGSTSPFARDASSAGMQPTWEHDSEHTTASEVIAARLGIEPGDPVMFTHYRFLADEHPIQLSESHEPLAVTGGTEVEWPEESPVVGVVARMDLIGAVITRVVEKVRARPASPDETEALGLDPRRGGLWVLAIERTYYAGEQAVETADIVFPSDRYELAYEMPIDPAPPA